MKPIYLLGGYQTDFAINWSRQNQTIFDMMRAAVFGALESVALDPAEIQTAHVGNFAAELFRGQGHLGGMFASLDPAFAGVPASRHEAACASGSIAALMAMAEIEAERYDLACVVGVEEMRNMHGDQAAQHLGAAAWVGQESLDACFLWPRQFSDLADEYDRRYGIKHDHLAAIAQNNFANAKLNPNAQTRKWTFNEHSFSQHDEFNPVIEGRTRKQDCGQVTDGAATIFLASERYARDYVKRRDMTLAAIPRIVGWGHRTAPLRLADKLNASRDHEYVFPHVRQTIVDAMSRANLNLEQINGWEIHDCFSMTEYMLIDHLGITPPGMSWQAIENVHIAKDGRYPLNPSGGLIGLGHPVGATGVRMLLDAYKQVTNSAGAYQVNNAKTFGTVNIGGSTTTTVSFIVQTT